MITYTYDTIEEFEDSFNDTVGLAEKSKVIVSAISEGIKKGAKEVILFSIDIEKGDGTYTVRAKASEWEAALVSCLGYLERVGCVDEVIDTYELIQKIKK